jgi:hypothetical protein
MGRKANGENVSKNVNLKQLDRMDIVIPYRTAKHEDLKYCLRSVERYLSGVRGVYIVGDDPGLRGVTLLPFEHVTGWEQANANLRDKLLAAIADPRISDDFLYMHDDHILVHHYGAVTFPYYYSVNWGGIGDYKILVRNTQKLFGERCFNFDIHCPMRFNKYQLKRILDRPWPHWGIGIKTLYALSCIPADQYVRFDDVKFNASYVPEIYERILNNRPWFSYGEKAYPGVGWFLEKKFPFKSKYE